MNRETGWKKRPEAKFPFFYSCSCIEKKEPTVLLQPCIIETITAVSIIFSGSTITVM